jgi:hypothetical protein
MVNDHESYRADAYFVGRVVVTLFMVAALPVVVLLGLIGGMIHGLGWILRRWWWDYIKAIWSPRESFT